MIVVEHAGEGALGAAFAQHMIAFGRKALAPLGVGQVHLVHGAHVGVPRRRINRGKVVWRDFRGAAC